MIFHAAYTFRLIFLGSGYSVNFMVYFSLYQCFEGFSPQEKAVCPCSVTGSLYTV